MRRSANEAIRKLETRIARLERQSALIYPQIHGVHGVYEISDLKDKEYIKNKLTETIPEVEWEVSKIEVKKNNREIEIEGRFKTKQLIEVHNRRKSAGGVLRNLEMRIARLEKQSGRSQGTTILENLRKSILDDIPYMVDEIGLDDKQEIINRVNIAHINLYRGKLADLVLTKIRAQLDQIEEKTKKERFILNRLAPNHFNFGKDGSVYQDLRLLDNSTWNSLEVFKKLERFKNRVATGRYLHRLEHMTNLFIDEAIEACREIGI